MDNRDLETIERLIVDLELEKPKRYSPEELQTLTSDFSKKLGSGSFGTVYKGILHNSVPVAVKVLKDEVLPDTIKDQFTAEVSTLGKTHHRNLVKLYGFCFAPNVKALVYEFMENESLEKILYEKESIAWETLCDIVVGTASGLTYLHKDCEPGIIHYDIKPSNILLNSKFCPKVGDFGLAKLLTTDKSHVTMSGFRGTPYYGAPELWMRSSSATYKCDVYSYGIMLFEILGRRRFDGQKSFPEQVWEKFKEGKLADLMQGCGIEEKNTEHAKRIFTVALWCVQYRPQDRPSMSNVVRLLEGREEVARPPNPFWPLEFSSTMTRPNLEFEEKEKEQRESVILGPWGGPGGGGWDDGVFSTIRQIQVVRGRRMILSIQTEYSAKNGDSIWSTRHGYTGADTVDTIQLDYPKEFLKRVTGFYQFEFGDNGMVLVQSLCFFTNKKRYGPFGVERGTYFTSGKDGKVVGFHGRCGAYLDAIGAELSNCLKGVDVVVIPAGVPRKPGMTRDDLFNINANIVKTLVEAVADNCPDAFIHIISNPVNSTVPIAAEILKQKGVYNPKKLFGVTTLDVVRANTFVAQKKNLRLIDVDVPVVGGHAGITILPLLSKTRPAANFTGQEIEELTVRIQNAGTEVVEAKAGEGSATLSMAYAAARFVESSLRALDGDTDVYECSFVQSELTELPFFASRIKLGKNGVEAVISSDVQGLTEYEAKALEALKPELKSSIEKGVAFAQKQAAPASV